MIRLAGSVCILGGGVLAVWQSVRERRRKRELLMELCGALHRMEESIRVLRMPLPRLMEEEAERCRTEARRLFECVSQGLKEGELLPLVWRGSSRQLTLERREREVLGAIFDGENFSCDSMCNAILLACNALEKQLEEQEKCQAEQAKRTAALYLSGAALLVILLI